MMTIEDRIEHLEAEIERMRRRNRRVLLGLGLAICAIGVVLRAERAMAPPTPNTPDEIVAKRFSVMNDQGKRCASFGSSPAGTSLLILQENGEQGVSIVCSKDLNYLSLYDANKVTRTKFLTANKGTGFELCDEKGVSRLVASLDNKGPALRINDAGGNLAAGLVGTNELGPVLSFADLNGNPRMTLGSFPAGPAVNIYDANKKLRTSLGSIVSTAPDGKKTSYPESTLMFLAPDGKTAHVFP